MEHSFDVAIAKEYGVHSAVLLKNLYFWIQKNAANGRHYHDGTYWTYNSRKAFAKLFPYMTARQIGYAIDKLIEDGLVKTGNFSRDAFDQTIWYAITEKGYSILQNCQMDDLTKSLSPFDKNVKSTLSDSKRTNDKPDSAGDKPQREKKRFVKPTVEEVAAYCRERQNTVDPETFVDFYTGKGWMVGKNKMADWKAAVRTWERNRSAESKFRESPPRDAFLEFLDEEAAKARG